MAGCCGGDDPAAYARQQELTRQQNISQGVRNIDQAFSGFNPAFYDASKQAYLNFASPQLAQQTHDATGGLTFQLARQGLLHSGAAENEGRALQRTTLQGQQQVSDAAAGQANALRGNVEQERSRLVNQLSSTGDPNIAAQQAASSAMNLRLPSQMAPIGNLFNNFAQMYLMKNLSQIYQQPYGGGMFYNQQPSNSLSFMPQTSSVRGF